MAKKAIVFSPAKWASLDEAFAKAKVGFGPSDLALYDLHGHMLGGRLRSAVRRLENDGKMVFEPLEPSFWGRRQLCGRVTRADLMGSCVARGRSRFTIAERCILTARIVGTSCCAGTSMNCTPQGRTWLTLGRAKQTPWRRRASSPDRSPRTTGRHGSRAGWS
jgi:hypothetical protein